MPNYTKIPKAFREAYKSKFVDLDLSKVSELAKQDPVVFGYYFLGKTVRLHQAFILDKFLKSFAKGRVRLAFCLARQLGKTIAACILFIWLCWYNKWPVTIANNTIVYVVSRDDETAKELLEKIRAILWEADRHMSNFSEIDNFFTGSLKEPNNTQQITFQNKAFIKSIPPTKKALGKSASLLFIDEAQRLNCTDIDSDTFFDYASPTVAETGGGIILSSSPEGTQGFFYKAIDPEGLDDSNDFESVWFSHTIWNEDTIECKRYQEHVESERKRLEKAGRLKYWQQEYESLFTVTETSFFDNEDLEFAIKDTSQRYNYKETPCSLGIDYGLTKSRTVLTVRTVINDELIQLFQVQCPAGFDNNKLVDGSWEHCIQKLKERYNLFMIVADDCAPGDTTNRWLMSNSGIEVRLYNFRSDQMSKNDGINRNCLAYSYRSSLKEGFLKLPKWNQTQLTEMRTVQETVQKILISIKSPTGQLCDTFDSDMMACLPFLNMTTVNDLEFDTSTPSTKVFEGEGCKYDSFHSPTDDECKEMISNANNYGEF